MSRTALTRLQSLLLVVAVAALLSSCADYKYNAATGVRAVTASSHIAVSDSENGRVLIFDAPFVTGERASVVLGQPDFSSYGWHGEGASALQGPIGLSADAAGNLYVADYNNGRVVQFHPPFTSYMSASMVLGVPTFTAPGDANDTNCYHNPPQMSLCMPAGVTLDKQGNIWVADTWEGRVVEYQPPLQSAMNASLVLGQPDMNHTANCDGVYTIYRDNTGAPMAATASQFCAPTATAIDSQGNVWVADGNNRILEFVPPFSSGMSATLELGFPPSVGMNSPTPFANQPCAPPSASSFCGPEALTFDAHGNLWVTDLENNRVLEFVPPFSSGMAASLVIGQPDFSHGDQLPASDKTFYFPDSVTFDSAGDIIVADELNNRVLIFTAPFSTGMSASAVIGQTDFTSGNPHGCGGFFGTSDSETFCHPQGVLSF